MLLTNLHFHQKNIKNHNPIWVMICSNPSGNMTIDSSMQKHIAYAICLTCFFSNCNSEAQIRPPHNPTKSLRMILAQKTWVMDNPRITQKKVLGFRP